MKLNKNQNILILACGGSGMNVLAQYFISLGCNVYGMDRSFDRYEKKRIKDVLIKKGLKVLSESADLKPLDIELVFTSPAIEESHQGLQYAKKKQIKITQRNEYLIELFNQHYGIGISGTSGKTTTTGMIGYVFNDLNQNPYIFCGDEIHNYSSKDELGNYIKGDQNFVLEVDESDIENFYKFKSKIACITTLEEDHYSLERLKDGFHELFKNSEKVVVNADHHHLKPFVDSYKEKVITVSRVDKTADYVFQIHEQDNADQLHYSVNGVEGILNIHGQYNILNAALTVALCCEYGLQIEHIIQSLSKFKGIKNRFEKTVKNGRNYILDFAHNPEKIKESILSSQKYGDSLTYIFQPHGYGPLRFMKDDLLRVLNQTLREQDDIVFLKIYDAGGTANRNIQSSDLLSLIKTTNKYYFETHDQLLDYIKSNQKKTIVLTGARDPGLRDLFDEIVSQ